MAVRADQVQPLATRPIVTGADYIASLRGRKLKVYLFGEIVAEPVDHPIIRPSINAVAETYDLAVRHPELATAVSPYTGERVNRFLHIATSPADLVMQNKMQRRLGQLTGTCFQRCVGMDAFNALHSVTFEIDETQGTQYQQRLLGFLTAVQRQNLVVGGAMTDVKGDRGKAPHEQADPDLFVHVSRRDDKGVYITRRQGPSDRLRELALAAGNAHHAPGAEGQATTPLSAPFRSMPRVLPISTAARAATPGPWKARSTSATSSFPARKRMIVFDDVFIPWERVFMDGEFDFAAMLVERFTCYHRRSYVCKTGVGDVLIGAAATVADYNGVEKASHIRDKLVEMTHLNETIYGTGVAASYQASRMKSGAWLSDDMLANVCKHHVTKMPYEIGRLAQDLAGGLMVTMPSEQEFNSPEVGELIRKYLKGRAEIPMEDRMRIMRLIENMTMGRNAVGYLTESMHGAGSPQAQRIQIARAMQLEFKKSLAKSLAGIAPESAEEPGEDESQYLARVFKPAPPL